MFTGVKLNIRNELSYVQMKANDFTTLLTQIRAGEHISPVQVNRIYHAIQEKDLNGVSNSFRLALLGTTTVEPFIPSLTVRAYAEGICLDTYLGPFNQIDQEIMNPSSGLYNHKPEVIILSIRMEEVCSPLVEKFSELKPDEVQSYFEMALDRIEGWLGTLRKKTDSMLCFNSISMPEAFSYGAEDWMAPSSQRSLWNRLNEQLSEIARSFPNVMMIDVEQITKKHGSDNIFDAKLWYLARMVGNPSYLWEWSNLYIPVLRNLAGLKKKCLVLDLDNTVWGGILGEDGLQGIQLGGDYPGNVFLDFQKQVLNLWHQGVILAINSKNNLEDVKEVFDSHNELLLEWNHFQVHAVNWNDKADNMREIASQINIGLDSLVFVDDNPVECERIRQALPEVSVFQVPKEIASFPKAFSELNYFRGARVLGEDQKRNEMYRNDKFRSQALDNVTSLEEFHSSLEMEMDVSYLVKVSLARTAQLLQKTNQFNLTTRRHNEGFLNSIMNSPEWKVYTLTMKDRFGNNGQVGVAIVSIDGENAELDSFLLSCRVIGRKAEDILLREIAKDLNSLGVKFLIGHYIATKKNIQVANIFQERGFEKVSSDELGAVYRTPLSSDDLYPELEYINVKFNGKE